MTRHFMINTHMWWRILLFKLGLRIGRKYLRDDRERIVDDLTKGEFNPLQQALLNELISRVIDHYIGQENLLDYLPGNYYNYIKKLMMARKIIVALFALISINRIQQRTSPDASLVYNDANQTYTKYKKIVDMKDRVLTETDRIFELLGALDGAPPTGDIEVHPDDLATAAKTLLV